MQGPGLGRRGGVRTSTTAAAGPTKAYSRPPSSESQQLRRKRAGRWPGEGEGGSAARQGPAPPHGGPRTSREGRRGPDAHCAPPACRTLTLTLPPPSLRGPRSLRHPNHRRGAGPGKGCACSELSSRGPWRCPFPTVPSPRPPAHPPPTLPVSHADPPCGHDAHRAGPWPGPEPQHLALCAHVWPGPSSPHASPSPPDTSLLSNCSPACGMPSSACRIPGPAAGLPPRSSDPAGALGSSAARLSLSVPCPHRPAGAALGLGHALPPGPHSEPSPSGQYQSLLPQPPPEPVAPAGSAPPPREAPWPPG